MQFGALLDGDAGGCGFRYTNGGFHRGDMIGWRDRSDSVNPAAVGSCPTIGVRTGSCKPRMQGSRQTVFVRAIVAFIEGVVS